MGFLDREHTAEHAGVFIVHDKSFSMMESEADNLCRFRAGVACDIGHTSPHRNSR
jgi:hypothetical protein